MTAIARHCSVAGCTNCIRIRPLVATGAPIDFPEGICRQCFGLVEPSLRAALRSARFELRLLGGCAEIVQLLQAWEAVQVDAVHRRQWWVRAA